MAIELDRADLLAYRAWIHGLHRGATTDDLDVLGIGLQDTPAGSAAFALRQRVGDTAPLDRPELVLALTIRGAPHLHRRSDLPVVRAALWPRDNDTLCAYLGGYGDELVASGADGPKLLELVVAEMRDAFPGETASKGQLSGVVSQRLPEIARPWCEGCGSSHVVDGLFRLATLYAGIELVPHDGRRLLFRLAEGVPDTGRTDQPGPTGRSGPARQVDSADPADPAGSAGRADADTTAELLRAYLRLAGPATLGDVVTWLDTRSVTAPPNWLRPSFDSLAEQLREVRVGGVTMFALAETVAAVGDAPPPPPPPPPVLLLPPRDAYLLGNRAFLVPDRALAKTVWRAIGSPGALVVDGEVAGTWRQRVSGRTLAVRVTPVGRLRKGVRAAVDEQAALLASTRGAGTLRSRVEWEE